MDDPFVIGAPDECLEKIARLHALGSTHVLARVETCKAARLWGSVTAQHRSFLVTNYTGPAPGAPEPAAVGGPFGQRGRD